MSKNSNKYCTVRSSFTLGKKKNYFFYVLLIRHWHINSQCPTEFFNEQSGFHLRHWIYFIFYVKNKEIHISELKAN